MGAFCRSLALTVLVLCIFALLSPALAIGGDYASDSPATLPITTKAGNETGPILWLRFNETSGQTIADSSGLGNDGWLGNASAPDQYDPAWVPGINGGGLGLDGWMDYATVPDDDSLDNFTAFTLEAWVNITDLPDGQAIIGKGQALLTPLYYLEVQDFGDDGNLEFSVDYRNQHGGIAEQLDASISFGYGEWHHAAATWDGTITRIYVDGVLAGERTTNLHLIPDNSFPLYIGRHDWGLAGNPVGSARRINGTIDEVKVYDRALSPSEVLESFYGGQGLPLDREAPVAHAGNDTVAFQGETVLFDASGSHDDTGIVNYTWSFVYDGRIRTLGTSYPSFTFDEPGIYSIALTVRDRTGKEDYDSFMVTVLDTTAPVPVAGVVRTVYEGSVVLLDASDSFDNVGIVGYTWKVIFNNVTEVFTGVNLSYAFDVVGSYTIVLEVVDANDNSAESQFVISVVEGPASDAEDGASWPWCLAVGLLTTSALIIGAGLAASIGRNERLYVATVATLMAAFASPGDREDLETRGMLKGMIMARPGIHYKWLRVQSGKGDGVVLYHLRELESLHEIISVSDGEYKRYYPGDLKPVGDGGREEGPQLKNAVVDLVRTRSGISENEMLLLLDAGAGDVKNVLDGLEREGVVKAHKGKGGTTFTLGKSGK